jgi:hypothetical protein
MSNFKIAGLEASIAGQAAHQTVRNRQWQTRKLRAAQQETCWPR